ncbi:hypothetical protein KJ780_04635 [Candidatus Micrarchaeota archaeon]|nr:hypothetical protein [Candidatus Micrarchaeota archaeon]
MAELTHKKVEKTRHAAIEAMWKEIEILLNEKGIVEKGLIPREKTAMEIFRDKDREFYSIQDFRGLFIQWTEERAINGKIKAQAPHEQASKKNMELCEFFLGKYFPEFRKAEASRHGTAKIGYSYGVQIPVRISGPISEKPTATIGVDRQDKTHFGDVEKSVGVQYKTDGTVGLTAGYRGAYAEAGIKDARLGVKHSALDIAGAWAKDKFGIIFGAAAGPFAYGYDILKGGLTGGVNWFFAGIDFVMTSIDKAKKRDKEKKTGFVKELAKVLLNPIEIVKTAFEVVVVKPILRIRDLFDMIFSGPGKKKGALDRIEFAKMMEKVEKAEEYGNFHTARKTARQMLQHDLDPLQKAYAQLTLDRVEYRMAYKGLPISLNPFVPGFLRSKRKMVERKINSEIDLAIKKINEIGPDMNAEERKQFVYLYNYLFVKASTEKTVEGYQMPIESPVPKKSLNPIIACIEKNQDRYAKIVAETAKEFNLEIKEGRFESALERTWEIDMLANSRGYWAIKDKYEESRLMDFISISKVFSPDKKISLAEISLYSDLIKSSDKKLTEFYLGMVLEEVKAKPKEIVDLARIRFKKIKKLDRKIAKLKKKEAEQDKPSDAKEIRDEIRELQEELKNERALLSAILELSEHAGIESSFKATEFGTMKEILSKK